MSYRGLTVGRGALAAVLLGMMLGCDEKTPISPDDTVTQVAGTYAGTVSYLTATPNDRCYSQFLRSLPNGHGYRAQLTVTQTNTALSGTLRGIDIPSECQFTGTISGSTVTWKQTACAQACSTFSDGTCAAERVCVADHEVNAQYTNGRISGSHKVSWDTFDPATGAPLGRIELTGGILVTRQ